MTFSGIVPEGTKIEWQIRAGLTMDPLKEKDWTTWITVAEGEHAVVEPQHSLQLEAFHWDPERSVTLPKVRYIQWRGILSTSDPLRRGGEGDRRPEGAEDLLRPPLPGSLPPPAGPRGLRCRGPGLPRGGGLLHAHHIFTNFCGNVARNGGQGL